MSLRDAGGWGGGELGMANEECRMGGTPNGGRLSDGLDGLGGSGWWGIGDGVGAIKGGFQSFLRNLGGFGGGNPMLKALG